MNRSYDTTSSVQRLTRALPLNDDEIRWKIGDPPGLAAACPPPRAALCFFVHERVDYDRTLGRLAAEWPAPKALELARA